MENEAKKLLEELEMINQQQKKLLVKFELYNGVTNTKEKAAIRLGRIKLKESIERTESFKKLITEKLDKTAFDTIGYNGSFDILKPEFMNPRTGKCTLQAPISACNRIDSHFRFFEAYLMSGMSAKDWLDFVNYNYASKHGGFHYTGDEIFGDDLEELFQLLELKGITVEPR